MKKTINWFMIPSTDFKRSVKFYSSIFDIKMSESKDPEGNNMAFFIDPKDGVHGIVHGIIGSNPKHKPSKDGIHIYFDVDGKLDNTLKLAKEQGGKIDVPKTSIGDMGFIAMIQDTEGNSIGLHSMS